MCWSLRNQYFIERYVKLRERGKSLIFLDLYHFACVMCLKILVNFHNLCTNIHTNMNCFMFGNWKYTVWNMVNMAWWLCISMNKYVKMHKSMHFCLLLKPWDKLLPSDQIIFIDADAFSILLTVFISFSVSFSVLNAKKDFKKWNVLS